MENQLATQHCRPLPPGTPPLPWPEVRALLESLDPGWRVVDGPCLGREFHSRDYGRLLRLTGGVGDLAQAEDHHPDLELVWGRLLVSVSTHSIGGLSQNDFVLAARIDLLARESSF